MQGQMGANGQRAEKSVSMSLGICPVELIIGNHIGKVSCRPLSAKDGESGHYTKDH